MAVLDSQQFLGTPLGTLAIFIISGFSISIVLALFFMWRFGRDSLSFKILFRVFLLFFPVAWVGLSIGSNLGNTTTSLDSWVNVILTFIISIAFMVPIMLNMNATLRSHIRVINNVAMTVAQGDLRTPEEFQNANTADILYPFYRSFIAMLGELVTVINDILNASTRVAGTAEEIAASSSEVSSSSNSISSIMETISAGSQDQVRRVLDATTAERDLESTIEESFEQIYDSLELVQEISEETNLLALNASIEAQRAGEYGRGFGIVAQNVRRLSDDSRSYSDEIGSVLNTTEVKIKESHRRIAEAIATIREVSEDVAASAEEVSASAEEQSATLQEMSAATQELANLAAKLEVSVKRFKIE